MKVIKVIIKVCLIFIIVVFLMGLFLNNLSYSFYKGDKKKDNLKVFPEKIDYGSGLTGYGYNLNKDSKAIILCFGGSYYTAYNTVGSFAYFYDVPFLAVDYYGSQDSEGSMNLKSMQKSAEDFYDWAKEKYPNRKIIVIGHSYGCGMASYLASVRECDNLFLAAGFTDLSDLYNKIIPVYLGPLKLLILDNIRVDEYARNTDCQVTIIGSENDNTLSSELQRELADCYKNADLHIFSDIEHEYYLIDQRVIDLILKALE